MAIILNWRRKPFYGGCHYVADHVFVTGYYSPSDPLEFEEDCDAWEASNLPGEVFDSEDAAMDAAEAAMVRAAREAAQPEEKGNEACLSG